MSKTNAASFRTLSLATSLATSMAASLAIGGCATQGYVRDQVAVVDQKTEANAQRLNRHDGQLAELDRTSREALDRARAAGKLAEGKFLYSLVLSDDSVKFPVGRASLSAEAQSRLAALVDKLRSENRNVYLEIQGHTDRSGNAEQNKKLGEDRAEAVRLFLNRGGVALNRMSAISYGQDAPIASNSTRQGRAQNRRVVVIVLA